MSDILYRLYPIFTVLEGGGFMIYAYDCITYLGSCFRLFLCELIKRVRCVGDEESPEPIPESDHPVVLLVIRGLCGHREHRERGGRRGGGGRHGSARQQAPSYSSEYGAILRLFTWLTGLGSN